MKRSKYVVPAVLIALFALSGCGETDRAQGTQAVQQPHAMKTDAVEFTNPPASAQREWSASSVNALWNELYSLAPAPAEDFDYHFNSDIQGISITAYNGAETAIRVPDMIDGYPVKEADLSECLCTAVVLPECLQTASLNPDVLETVNAPCTIDFRSLRAIRNADICPTAEFDFYYCPTIESVRLPAGVTEIANSTFEGSKSLSYIDIPDSVTYIDSYAFSRCTSLKGFAFPAGVSETGYSAFSLCSALESVTIPDTITEISDYSFDGCSSLKNVTIPDSVTEIGWFAFNDCTALTSITIPAGVTKLNRGVFMNCTGLTSVTLPDGITEIGKEAFFGCTGLTELTLPDSVKKIGEAFSGCEGISVVYKGSTYTYEKIAELYAAINAA